METKFNFNSSPCTSKEQSERLLALGLKKEASDCYWFYCDIAKEWKCTILSTTQVFKDYPTTIIPAWSLHRLLSMLPSYIDEFRLKSDLVYSVEYENLIGFIKGYLYDNIIDCIEWLIKEGYFNKEYLEE